jgi:hypothetical protein
VSDDEASADFGLVMPFVVCESNGGPYADEAFVAGARFGRWAELLKLQPAAHREYEPAGLVPQLDLLAMHNHYTMTTEPWDDDTSWVLVTMSIGAGEI